MEQIAQIHVLHAPRSNLRRKLTIKDLSNAHQGGDKIDTWHVIDVVDLHVASYTLVATALDRALEYMRVVKVLHRLCAQIDAQVLQLARLWILESEHVQDPDETVGCVSHRVVQRGHASGTGATCA